MGAVQQACCGTFREHIQKIVKGVLILNVHQINEGIPLNKITDQNLLQSIIKQSLISLQEKSNIFIPHTQQLSPEQIDQIQKNDGGFCGGKYKINSKHNAIAGPNITFSKYKVNTTTYPFVVSFELSVDMLEGDHIFCENLEKQNYEIFNESQNLAEISYISCFWFLREKNFQNMAQQNHGKLKPHEQFLTDNEDQQIQNQQQQQQINQNKNVYNSNSKELQQQFDQIPENMEEEGVPSLEISYPYFEQNYCKIYQIYESEAICITLYYDEEKDKLLTVKEFKNKFSHIKQNNELIENEKKRVLTAIRGTHLPDNERFIDIYDDDMKILKRNIVREIMISYFCNDYDFKGINKLEGVIVGQKNILIAYEFFGDAEINSKQLTCDLQSYFSKNLQNYFHNKNYEQTQEILQEVIFNIMKVVEQLHKQGVFMRELQPQDILIRRRFNPVRPQTSEYEICLVNFGKAKRITTDSHNKTLSMNYQHSVKVLSKPQQLFGKDANQNKNFIDFQRDDIFQLGILLYKLYLILGLENQLDEQTQQNLERMTGLPFHSLTQFYEIMAKLKDVFKGGLEEVMKYEQNIKDISQIQNQWNQTTEKKQDSVKHSQEQEQYKQMFQQQVQTQITQQ